MVTGDDGFGFETGRLRCGPWIEEARRIGADLVSIVAELLTPRTTVGLPPAWHGEFSAERAKAWIEERATDSTTLLVTEKSSHQPIGLVILAALLPDDVDVDLRVGYVITDTWWGRGIATELVAGLVDWGRRQPAIASMTAGVDPGNAASVRVLERSGFRHVAPDGDGDGEPMVFRVDVLNEWDAHASGWDDDPAARAYAKAAFEALEQLLRRKTLSLDGATVLDFGCGTGLLTERLVGAGATVHAIDTSGAMLDVLRAKGQLFETGRVIAGATLPTGQVCRVVVCSSVCAFLDDYPATVVELLARLEPGGLFVQWDWEPTHGDDHGLTRAEIATALGAAGLVDVEVAVGFDTETDGQRMVPLMGWGRRPPAPG